MDSTSLYNVSTAGYLMSLMLFAIHVINVRRVLLKAGIVAVALSFLVQTAGMVARWVEAGLLEVDAAEKAVGQTLTGWSWFVVFTQHPPWSNLYEIMIYMSWGIVMVTLMAELAWQLSWVRQMGIILALMALGVASLTDATIKPLVPALKSWWIMIHVISASIAYAAGSIAAFICLLALMKDEARVQKERFIGFALIAMGVLLFALGGGPRLFVEQAYFVKLLSFAGEHVINVTNMATEKASSYMVPMPGVGYLLMVAVVAHVVVGMVLVLGRSFRAVKNYLTWLYIACFVASCGSLLTVLVHDLRSTAITSIDPAIGHHLSTQGPWFISFKSHPWSFALLIMVIIIEMFILLYLLYPNSIKSRLPEVAQLEGASYRAISLSFFLMTLVLITGALWAHYAWGRYWAWDPKETGALAIWLNYAIYLHARRTSGLSGPFSSVIGVLGFFVIIIGFLGVNLGLFADGLHTYGNN
jgi:cytochrome c-type biogenesis protein CcsB